MAVLDDIVVVDCMLSWSYSSFQVCVCVCVWVLTFWLLLLFLPKKNSSWTNEGNFSEMLSCFIGALYFIFYFLFFWEQNNFIWWSLPLLQVLYQQEKNKHVFRAAICFNICHDSKVGKDEASDCKKKTKKILAIFFYFSCKLYLFFVNENFFSIRITYLFE